MPSKLPIKFRNKVILTLPSVGLRRTLWTTFLSTRMAMSSPPKTPEQKELENRRQDLEKILGGLSVNPGRVTLSYRLEHKLTDSQFFDLSKKREEEYLKVLDILNRAIKGIQGKHEGKRRRKFVPVENGELLVALTYVKQHQAGTPDVLELVDKIIPILKGRRPR